jgi:hypothetical protein
MRKSDFVLAAAVILAASAASSAARADALPKEVLGSWCPDTDDGSHTSYKRGKPGGGAILGTLKNGTVVINLNEQNGKWLKIDTLKGNKTGWVFHQFLECE